MQDQKPPPKSKGMRRLKDEIVLQSKFECITVSDLRAHPGEVLAYIELGKTYLVTRQGKAVAVMSKPPGETLTMTFDGTGKLDYEP